MRSLATPILLTLALCAGANPASADQFQTDIEGQCEEGQFTAAHVWIDFIPTGGDFDPAVRTGTATVRFTIENTSGVYPYQDPPLGNPIFTSFYFNVPPETSVSYEEARILAGSTFSSTGTTINGVDVPAGCTVLPVDLVRTEFYELTGQSSTGQYGIFTNSLQTVNGVAAGLVDPEVYVNCVAQGDVFSPAVVAGQVRFEIDLAALDTRLDSASDFQNLCSFHGNEPDISSFAGKFQATGTNGEGSCFQGRGCATPVEERSWGSVKAVYR